MSKCLFGFWLLEEIGPELSLLLIAAEVPATGFLSAFAYDSVAHLHVFVSFIANRSRHLSRLEYQEVNHSAFIGVQDNRQEWLARNVCLLVPKDDLSALESAGEVHITAFGVVLTA